MKLLFKCPLDKKCTSVIKYNEFYDFESDQNSHLNTCKFRKWKCKVCENDIYYYKRISHRHDCDKNS